MTLEWTIILIMGILLVIMAVIIFTLKPLSSKDKDALEKEIRDLKEDVKKQEFEVQKAKLNAEQKIELAEIKMKHFQNIVDTGIENSPEYMKMAQRVGFLEEKFTQAAANEQRTKDELMKAFGQNSELIKEVYKKYDNNSYQNVKEGIAINEAK